MLGVELYRLNIPELKTLLKVNCLDTKGNKNELILRLQENVPEYNIGAAYTTMNASSGSAVPCGHDISPHDSISQQGSVRTKSSSSSRAHAKAAAKRAALEVKAEFFEEQQALSYKIKKEQMRRALDRKHQEFAEEEEELRLQQELQRMEIQAEISAAKAEEEVLDRYCTYKQQSGVSLTMPKLYPFTSAPVYGGNPRHAPTPSLDHNVHRTASHPGAKPVCDDSFDLHSPISPRTDHNVAAPTVAAAASAVPRIVHSTPKDLNPDAEEWRPSALSLEDKAALRSVQIQVQEQSENIKRCVRALQSLKNDSTVQPPNCTEVYADVLSLPKSTMMEFSGDPLDFWLFMNTFDSCVGSLNVSDAAKLTRLLEYCKGKANRVIKPCALMAPTAGYQRARELLVERFGNEYQISRAWIKKVSDGPPVRANSGDDLQDMADDVRGCIETLRAMGRYADSNTETVMVKIANRLPFHLQSRWRKEAVETLRNTGSYPDLDLLQRFLCRVAREINDPVFGVLQNKPISKDSKQKPKPKCFSASASKDTSEAQKAAPKPETYKPTCSLCSKDHYLNVCVKFKDLSPDKRLDFVKENKLCYNCLKSKHTAKWCLNKSSCGVQDCRRRHSKLLHDALPPPMTAVRENTVAESETPAASSCACASPTPDSTKIALPFVAVRVKAADADHSVLTHAFLDPGSTKSFCSRQLLQKLGIHGESTTLALSTLNDENSCNAEEVTLEVSGTRQKKTVVLPRVYAIDTFPNLTTNCATQDDLNKWDHLRDITIPSDSLDVSLLIGQDNPNVLAPLEVRRGGDMEPYAVRCCLGWMINGPVGENSSIAYSALCNFVRENSQDKLMKQVEQFWKIDTPPMLSSCTAEYSSDDKRAVDTWNESICMKNGHYEMDIPFDKQPPELPNNRYMAEKRLEHLKHRFKKKPELHQKYADGMQDLIQKQFAEKVPDDEIDVSPGKTWYLPHHNVVNPNKPDKLRIVFDCAAEFGGTSLNSEVLQGPDLTNKLLGVLLRFREQPIAVMADIEAMFHQVKVTPKDRDVLRFLWWPNGDISKTPDTYRMTVHLFGGVWSPSCASFAVRRTAEDHITEFEPDVINAVLENFYVDDLLKSLCSEDKAIDVVSKLRQLLELGGFRLTKWVSNSVKVMENIPEQERAKGVKDLSCPLPTERALGVQWLTDEDQLGIRVNKKQAPLTRRGLLSTMSSVYDPLGFVAPCIVLAKKIFQAECRTRKGWDDELETDHASQWVKWQEELPALEEFQLPRCLVPPSFGPIAEARIHHFSDASLEAYGAVSYLRLINTEDQVHCAFLMAKSRLAPIKTMSIPRLELSAAVVAVQMDRMLRTELRIPLKESVFHTDSQVVLQYITNTRLRLQTFVANRVAIIHDGSSPSQWVHVTSEQNPADHLSRGMRAQKLVLCEEWKKGPSFLWNPDVDWTSEIPELSYDDTEVKKTGKSHATPATTDEDIIEKLMERYSDWYRLKKAVAWILRFKRYLFNKKDCSKSKHLDVAELQAAELAIVAHIQRRSYKEELDALQKGDKLKKSSKIWRLEPICVQGLLRVGGRLGVAPIADETKHQLILPRNHHVTKIIVRYIHEHEAGHSGRDHVLSVIRMKYWISKPHPLIRRVLHECVSCRRVQALACDQQMAGLPKDRVTPDKPPFTSVGIDCFGPFYVKRGRGREKRYGCIYTCLTTRAIHIEKLYSMDTDSFINSLRRFIARRGPPDVIRSDNGTNFVGGQRELREAVDQWNASAKCKDYLLLNHIEWYFNPPFASHMGGVWERQIRTVRKVLNAIMKDTVLDDQQLDTLFCEVESIVNSRPITPVSSDPKDYEPLTPNHLLTLRVGQVAPPGLFDKHDIYRRRWRHVQLLADHFWRRWVREYLPLLQLRQKWLVSKPNLCEGDIVLIMDEQLPRKAWPLARITKVFTGRDGLVRSAQVKTQYSVLTRPVHKLCLLEGVGQ